MTTFPQSQESFREILEEKRLYADKTEYAHRLLSDGRFFCLFRPRGFGKSLFQDTLRELFDGSRELFGNLFLGRSGHDFQRYPTISLDLASFDSGRPGSFGEELAWELKKIALFHEAAVRGNAPGTLLSWLVDALWAKHGKKVVVLVDGVDEPVRSKADDPRLASENARAVETFLASLVSRRDGIRFCLLTGITKPASVFNGKLSGFFRDVTVSPRYGGICGITGEEFFGLLREPLSEILDLARRDDGPNPVRNMEDFKEELGRWYGGHSFDAETRVYDPASLSAFMENAIWDRYFAERRQDPRIVRLAAANPEILFPRDDIVHDRSSLLSVKDYGVASGPLLCREGIFAAVAKKEDGGAAAYVLDYPNPEVEWAFHLAALSEISGVDEPNVKVFLREFKEKALAPDPEGLALCLRSFLLKAASLARRAASPGNKSAAPADLFGDPGGYRGGVKNGAEKKREKARERRRERDDDPVSITDDRGAPPFDPSGDPDGETEIESETLPPHLKGLTGRISAMVSLALSLSGFRVKRSKSSLVSSRAVLKNPSDKRIAVILRYFPASAALPAGGRIRLLNEALTDALDKAANGVRAAGPADKNEVREIHLFAAGEYDAVAGVHSRQGGFYWRPLSKAPFG
ncbi:MAG: AAA family ATPase [Deltaproteobacteria bacterium]|jgi:hypothetical protein|nr:AAA family ATPase [Deltaproteobacteria bacterium]